MKNFFKIFSNGKSTINIDDFKKTITKEIDHLPKSNDIIIKPKELDREIYLNVTFLYSNNINFIR